MRQAISTAPPSWYSTPPTTGHLAVQEQPRVFSWRGSCAGTVSMQTKLLRKPQRPRARGNRTRHC